MQFNRSRTALAFVFALVMTALSALPLAARQDAPATGCVSDVTVTRLGHGLPSAAEGLELTLLRVTFAPGGSIGAHIHPGALTLSIESGALAYTMLDGHAEVQRAPVEGTPVPTEMLAAGQEAILNPGDWLFEESMVHMARNDGTEPAVVLVSGLMRAGEPFTQCVEWPATPDA
jgi:quercetin dioxygenase-like cupin family protein